MIDSRAAVVPYQPRRRAAVWPDLLVAGLMLLAPLAWVAGELLNGRWTRPLEDVAMMCFTAGLLMPWAPAAWSWFRLAPALARLVGRDFRQDMAVTLRSPREIVAGELGLRAVWSALPALTLMGLVAVGGAVTLLTELDSDNALLFVDVGFCFVVSTPVLLLFSWCLLGWLARRQLARGDGGWLAWPLIHLVVASAAMIAANFVLVAGVLMLLLALVALLEPAFGALKFVPMILILGVLVVVTAVIVAGAVWVLRRHAAAFERGLWWFEDGDAPASGSTTNAATAPREPLSLVHLRWARRALFNVGLIVVGAYGAAVVLHHDSYPHRVDESLLVLGMFAMAGLAMLSALDARVSLAGLRVDERTRGASANRALLGVAVWPMVWLVSILAIAATPLVLTVATPRPDGGPADPWDAYRNIEAMSGSIVAAAWACLLGWIVALRDARASLATPPSRSSVAGFVVRLLAYPLGMAVATMLFVGLLVAPTVWMDIVGGGGTGKLTMAIALATWGGILLLVECWVLVLSVIVWRRAWNARPEAMAKVGAS